jgi:hypothetical protein
MRMIQENCFTPEFSGPGQINFAARSPHPGYLDKLIKDFFHLSLLDTGATKIASIICHLLYAKSNKNGEKYTDIRN